MACSVDGSDRAIPGRGVGDCHVCCHALHAQGNEDPTTSLRRAFCTSAGEVPVECHLTTEDVAGLVARVAFVVSTKTEAWSICHIMVEC